MMEEKSLNPLDINGQGFDPDLYLQKLFKECTLKQVMDQENEIIRDTQTLHSDMQTLVYENYNKFISATDTVRKMKTDFKKMENEMDLLANNMESITSFSEQISSTLQDTRNQINKLSGVHTLLKRLQFLFKLPSTLKTLMEEKNYSQAVDDYIHAQKVLKQYGNMPSFEGIQKDCELILQDLKIELRNQFHNSNAPAKELAKCVDLLLQLKEPSNDLCSEFLSCAEKRLNDQLVLLQDQSDHKDVIEFVDLGCMGFLTDLSVVISAFIDMFINRDTSSDNDDIVNFESFALLQLNTFVGNNIKRYFSLIQSKIDMEQEICDTVILSRALDRFYRQLQALHSIGDNSDFSERGLEIVVSAGRKQCKAHLHTLKVHFSDSITKVRQTLTAPKAQQESNNLNELLTSVVVSIVEKIKGILQDLLVFTKSDVAYSSKPRFRESFCIESVREGLVVGFINHFMSTSRNFCDRNVCDQKCPPTLILLLSKLCLEFEATSIHYLLSQTDELFNISALQNPLITTEGQINDTIQDVAQELLNYFVRIQGLNVSQMLRKSVETRDWLHTIEPRTVRAVMKRVVEDIAAIDTTVGLLYEDQGSNTEHSSDSSRKTHSISVSRHLYRSNWSSFTPNQLESSIVTNIHKLFSERIEIFTQVEFSKVSILTGIIKISLKTFLECVRLKTYSKFGLQQIQVDTHYLQLYLWRFVADENVVHFLLDEILGSAVHRCLDPVLMEPSVVDIICERG